jgi:hypothetical protein
MDKSALRPPFRCNKLSIENRQIGRGFTFFPIIHRRAFPLAYPLSSHGPGAGTRAASETLSRIDKWAYARTLNQMASAAYYKEQAQALMERVARADPETAHRLRKRAQEYLDLALAREEQPHGYHVSQSALP